MSSGGRHGRRTTASVREDDARINRLIQDYQRDVKGALAPVAAAETEEAPPSDRTNTSGKKKTFFLSITNSPELQNVIFRYLSRDRGEGVDNEDVAVLHSLCDMFLAFYRWNSGVAASASIAATHQRVNHNLAAASSAGGSFTLASVAKDAERSRPIVVQYLPHLVAIYLLASHRSPEEKKQLKFIETFLLVLYNCEAVETSPDLKGSNSVNVRVPGLSCNSVYHDSGRLDMSSVEMDRVGGVSLKTRPFQPVNSVNASTRPKILHLLFHVYNNHIMDISKSLGLESYMKVILRILGRGHVQVSLRSSTRVRSQSGCARIHLPPPVLIELLISAHHCIFNGLSTLGNQVVDLIELKASANGWSEVLLVCNAMTNLAKTWSASDGTGRGLRAATTDAHYANSPGLQLAKHMITNASFRAKKISEDIPKVLEKPGDQDMRNKLMTNMKSITEEMGDEFPQLNKEMSALGNAPTGGLGNTKTPTKGAAPQPPTTGVPGGGSESAEKRTKKEQFIAKLPNLKEKLHKKTDKHVVLSDHVVDSGGGVGGADGQDDTEGVGGMGHNNQSMSAAGAPSGGQTSAATKSGHHSHRLSIEHTKEELVLLLPGKKRSKAKSSGGGATAESAEKSELNEAQPSSSSVKRSDKKKESGDSGFGSQGSGEKGPSGSGQRQKQSKSEGVAASLVPSKIRHKRDEKREKKEAEKAAAAAAAALNSIQEAATGGASSHDDHVALIPPVGGGGGIETALSVESNGQLYGGEGGEALATDTQPAADTVEKVQELVKTKRLPQETITIHSPESGTTIF